MSDDYWIFEYCVVFAVWLHLVEGGAEVEAVYGNEYLLVHELWGRESEEFPFWTVEVHMEIGFSLQH